MDTEVGMAIGDLIDIAKRTMIAPRANQSYFPNLFSERDDLLKDADNAFYGGGQVQPTPTPAPSPTPTPRSYFSGVPNGNIANPGQSTFMQPTTPKLNNFSLPPNPI